MLKGFPCLWKSTIGYGAQVAQYPVIPLAKEKLVDTNGAGDAFVGGESPHLSLQPSMLADDLPEQLHSSIRLCLEANF